MYIMLQGMHAPSILYALFLHVLESSLFSLVCAWHKLLYSVLHHRLQSEHLSHSVGIPPSRTACLIHTVSASSVQSVALLPYGWLDSSFGMILWQRRNSILKTQAREHLESTNMNMSSANISKER